ncbi:hypothetical protein [Chryseobacterium sp. NKUCC03_KSP]|uniref:hypothetical protein n=1 Tax=Chryseobacterium sp. NKUCC03_KSP TaxID=2842125 RepID=UPI001C5B7733|nr:hypothetical protein [Chryseobacterium sp. NKUCC03_KSP]MBW3524570.1 hypothetical protein [Chryseobacterium sp. NKUCC03_KSP]
MKKIFFYLVVIFFYQCQAQKKPTHNNTPMNIIDSSFEKLNINDSTLLKTKKRYGTADPPKYIVNLNETLQSGTSIETYGLLDTYYDQWITPSRGWFRYYKEFYSDGNVKLKRIYNKTSDGNYGFLYEFDKEGKLLRTTDFEKDWKTSFIGITEIANKYAKKFNYKVDTSEDGIIISKNDQQWDKEYVKIWRKEKNGKRYWLIGFNKGHPENTDDKKCERLVILIDDINGKTLKKEHYFDAYNHIFKELDE